MIWYKFCVVSLPAAPRLYNTSLVLSCMRPRPCPLAAFILAIHPCPCPGLAWLVLSSPHCLSGSLRGHWETKVSAPTQVTQAHTSTFTSTSSTLPTILASSHFASCASLEPGTTASACGLCTRCNWCHSLLESSCLFFLSLLLPHPIVCRDPAILVLLLGPLLPVSPHRYSRPPFFCHHNSPKSTLARAQLHTRSAM